MAFTSNNTWFLLISICPETQFGSRDNMLQHSDGVERGGQQVYRCWPTENRGGEQLGFDFFDKKTDLLEAPSLPCSWYATVYNHNPPKQLTTSATKRSTVAARTRTPRSNCRSSSMNPSSLIDPSRLPLKSTLPRGTPLSTGRDNWPYSSRRWPDVELSEREHIIRRSTAPYSNDQHRVRGVVISLPSSQWWWNEFKCGQRPTHPRHTQPTIPRGR